MEVKSGYKQTEIGVIPEDWEVRPLNSLGELLSSKRIFEHDYVKSGVPFYRGKEISLLIENHALEDEYFISEDRYNTIVKTYGAPIKNDILITAVGTLGNVYLVPDDRCFYFKDGNVIWMRSIKGADPEYLSIQLRNLKKYILDNAIGSTQKALTIIVLKETPIPTPPSKKEQRAIATALSDVDALIASLDKLIAKKRAIKTATMQQLLTGKKRLPGFSGEWEKSTLGQICSFENGDRSSNYPSPESFRQSGIPFINAGHIADGKISTSEMNYITQAAYDRLGGGKVKAGDMLFCLRGSLGKFGLVSSSFGQGAIASSLVIIRPQDAALSREFLRCYLSSALCAQMIETWAGGAAQPNLSVKELARFSIWQPSLSEQTAIATVLSDMDAEITALEGRRDKTRAIKQGMMQELLTGRTRLI